MYLELWQCQACSKIFSSRCRRGPWIPGKLNLLQSRVVLSLLPLASCQSRPRWSRACLNKESLDLQPVVDSLVKFAIRRVLLTEDNRQIMWSYSRKPGVNPTSEMMSIVNKNSHFAIWEFCRQACYTLPRLDLNAQLMSDFLQELIDWLILLTCEPRHLLVRLKLFKFFEST